MVLAGIFSDLESLGLDEAQNFQVFNDVKVDEQEMIEKAKLELIESILYTAKLKCPVCHREILFRTLKSGKIRLVKTDLDLRPIYDIIDPSIYEVAVCNVCGYAALKKMFLSITSKKIDSIKNNISAKFVGRTYPDIYDYEIAIERYKLALLDAIVMEVKDSEKAYLCLKIAWLYRGYLEQEKNCDDKKREEYEINENTFLEHALDGFKIAHFKEKFPSMGLDDLTVTFLIGELSRRIGKNEDALKWLSEVIISKVASRRLKDRALESKELIKQVKGAN
ncbi:MAG: DUF2225 domain-containing protein [Firmicutes bacterium HGW-Firmicutes-7]|nr:MAG: DUF2225 domain-containing protein [Firmicutes bacterium HGW-Firmicutes-7]